jgi:hypothetical protein
MNGNENAQREVIETVDRICITSGWHVLMHETIMEDAWPATGEKDRRPAGKLGVSMGELSALSLAYGGLQPYPGSLTAERAEKALNDNREGRQFRVTHREFECAYEVHRIR